MYIKQTNIVDSPNYPFLKVERFEIEQINNINYQCKYPSYGCVFLSLLGNAVCEDVDTKNKIVFSNPEYKANMYIADYDFAKFVGTNNRKLQMEALDILQDIYEAIEYKAVKTYDEDHGTHYIFYIHFIICNQYITKGTYSRQNKDAFSNVMAIASHSGFFLVNKEEFYNTFYNNQIYPHSLKDFYFLLRLNTIFCSDVISDSVPDDLKHTHIAVWKIEKKTSLEDVRYSLYCRQKDLAEFLGIDNKTVQRYLKLLKKAGLLDYAYMHKRGTVILFTALDDNESPEKIFYPEPENIESISVDENGDKYIYEEITDNSRIECVVNAIKKHIQKINGKLKTVCKSLYSMINRKMLFLNLSKFKERFFS